MAVEGGIEYAPGFQYEVCTYEVKLGFKQTGLLGFVYKRQAGNLVVTKLQPNSVARSTPHACEGMVLSRLRVPVAANGAAATAGRVMLKTISLAEHTEEELSLDAVMKLL
eukprot:COSAG05_NODE_1239_length_5425_cov_3.841532_1_plen_110_part_00